MKSTLAILLLFVNLQASAECMATGYRVGSQITSYWVMSKESLVDDWSAYIATKESPFVPETDDPGNADNLCLVRVANQINQSVIDFPNSKNIILKQKCSDIEVGKKHRIYVSSYCMEFTENFYTSLPYEFGVITQKKKY
jgi:hypothetical protein